MNVVYFLMVLAVVAFGLVLLPRLIFPVRTVEGTFLDRVMAGAVWMTALTLAAMYVLGTFGMMEMIGLIVVWIAAWWVFKGRLQERGRLRRATESFFVLSDLRETKGTRGVVDEVGGGARTRTGRALRRRVRRFREQNSSPADLAVCLGVLGVLAVSAVLRLSRAWTHIELVPQDSYLALSWTKFLNTGVLLGDGTYPQGTYMWMSFLDRFYVFDTFTFTRFVSPLMGVLELVAMYWVVSRIARSRVAGLLAISVFGLFAGHPALLVDWSRQIGSMTQEFALAFGLVSLTYGAKYMSERRTVDLTLAGAALFVALTSNTLVTGFLAIGYLAILGVGLATGKWTAQTFARMVVTGLVAFVAANYFFLLGWLWNVPLAQSFELYDPLGEATFDAPRDLVRVVGGEQLRTNILYQLGLVAGIVGAVVGGVLSAARDRRFGPPLAAFSLAVVGMLLFYDFVAVRFGTLFRVRQGWIAGELIPVALGLGIGALVLAVGYALRVRDPLWGNGSERRAPAFVGAKVAALAVAVLVVAAMWPTYSVFARTASPSGPPEATEVSLDIIESHERFTYTVVGVSEQYQEVLLNGFFVEAWVFARDVTFSDARDPDFELPIPTNDVYIFAEKETFSGPQARPYGPTQEYYRNIEKRERIMQRILAWSETYRRFHNDMRIYYDSPTLRVYHLHRRVDVERADRDPAFQDYTWHPGELFTNDEDVTADRVRRDPEGAIEPTDPRRE